MPIWTVDRCRIRPGAESYFLQQCSALSPEPLTLFRDLEKPGVFWPPARWESRDTLKLNEWRTSVRYNTALSVVKEDVLEHVTHLMETFRRSRRNMEEASQPREHPRSWRRACLADRAVSS